jgi:hypothetical protein
MATKNFTAAGDLWLHRYPRDHVDACVSAGLERCEETRIVVPTMAQALGPARRESNRLAQRRYRARKMEAMG